MIFRISASMILLSGVALAQTLPSPRVAVPTDPTGATPKGYVDTLVIGKLNASGDTVNGPLVWLNPNPGAQDTRFAAGGLTNGVIIAAGGNRISYCPPLSCVTSPSADHQRTSALFWATTSDDGHSEEQTVAIETIIGTGYSRPWLPLTAYAVGENVQFPGANTTYRATQSGTSAAAGPGPTGKAADVVDGTVHWAWINDQRITSKVGLYNETVVVPGAGASWAQANNTSLQPGVTPTFNINTELDFTNNALECAIGVANCNLLEMSIGGAFRSTQGVHLSSPNPGPTYASHWGIRLNSAFLASDADIEIDSSAAVGLGFNASNLGGSHSTASIHDNSTGPRSYLVTSTHTSSDFAVWGSSPAAYANIGTHALGTFFDNSASPVVIAISGAHAQQTFGDTSTTPAAINLSGTYGLAAITTSLATTPIALQASSGQKVCFNGISNCVSYSAVSGKFFFTNNANVVKASLDNSGNMILSGTLTQSGTP